jgi:hypothetical protein
MRKEYLYLLLPGVLPPHLVKQTQSIMLGPLEPDLGVALRPAQQHQVQAGHAGHVRHRANQEVKGIGRGQAKPGKLIFTPDSWASDDP